MHRLVLLLAVVVAGTCVAASGATAPGPNGLLVYQATVGDHVQLFTVRPDGSDSRQLTDVDASDAVSAAWSPNGKNVVFEHDLPDATEIEVVDVNNGTTRRLTEPGLWFQPSYSPNGKEIAVDRTLPDGDGLWVVNTHGKGLRRVTHNPPAGPDQCLCDGSPVFSPDGHRIAFVREVDALTTAVFVVDANGRHLRQVTPWEMGVTGKLDWSPDGSRLLVSTPQAERPNTASNVITVRPDGTGLVRLTHDAAPGIRNLADGFAPDGTRIVFARRDPDGLQLWVMDADGTDATQITHGIDAHWANWGTHP